MKITPLINEILAEMDSAHEKHGKDYMGNQTDRALMLTILAEEVGECARHVCDGTDWRDEMVQVAAMALAAIMATDALVIGGVE